MKRVLTFGTFDGVHDGHRNMLAQAKELGSELVVAIAPDHIVQELKGTNPDFNFERRLELLTKEQSVDVAIKGDSKTGSWEILSELQPQIIALGYDQRELESSLHTHLQSWPAGQEKPKIVVLEAYKPETLHNSLLKRKTST